MKKHIKEYYDYFQLGEQDFIFCEWHYVRYGIKTKADDLHHIQYKSRGGKDEITNIIALNRKIHDAAHDEQIKPETLSKVHLEYLELNPY